MTHCSDEDLVLHYYGEDQRRPDVGQHLSACGECASRFRDLAGSLGLMTAPDVPERDDRYGLEVWQRIRHRLPERESMWAGLWGRWKIPALSSAAAVLLVAGFVAGRLWSPAGDAPPSTARAGAPSTPAVERSNDAARRVLLLSVADHLERSDRFLTEIVNANAADIPAEQQAAEDLLADSRLYRQDAVDSDERFVAAILDDLERTLLDIVNRPALTDADLDEMRRRIDSAALLFKVRVMSTELRRRERPAPAPRTPVASSSRTS